jgi:hypothetical protein
MSQVFSPRGARQEDTATSEAKATWKASLVLNRISVAKATNRRGAHHIEGGTEEMAQLLRITQPLSY